MRFVRDKIELILAKYSLYILLVFCAFLVFSLAGNIRNSMDAKDRVYEVENRINNLEEENKELERNLEIAKSEEFMEENLRDELGYVKEGEIVLVLPEDEDYIRSYAPKLPEEKDLLPDPNWKKWAKLFL